MKRSTLGSFLALPLLAFGSASCTTVQQIRVPVVRPAPVDFAGGRTLAIHRFAGSDAGSLEGDFVRALRGATNPATGKPGFEVLDRSQVDHLLDRMQGAGSTEIDTKGKELLARWRSVEVILKPTVAEHGVRETVEVTPQVNAKVFQGVTLTRQATAVVRLEVRALDGKDRTLDQVELVGRAQRTTKATNGKPASIDHAALLANARAQVVQRYLARVMPRREFVGVNLYFDKTLPDLQVGNGFAQTGDWQAAHDSYRTATEQATGELAKVRYKALFNLGVALEFTQRFAEARKAMQDAFRLEQDRIITAELSRLARREKDAARMRPQPQNATPGQ
ncbi:MAG: hypothetical protein KDC87_12285 [Planctomycetes bacterium]|nr:hypothetical protein [Planctomycetota bacterium]MCB9871693.1 hypothetical protein [Planctomycetota bacterium]